MEFSIPAASSSKRSRQNMNFERPTPPTTPQPHRYYHIKASTRLHNKQNPVLERHETAPIPEPTRHQTERLQRTSVLRRCHTAPEEKNTAILKERPQKKEKKSWTHDNWKDLSRYYEAVGRDIAKSVKAFYRHESLQLYQDRNGNYDITELWSKNFIKVRVICLSIVTKRHRGVPLLDRINAYNEKKRKQQEEDAKIDSKHINFKKARRQIVKESDF